MIALMSCNHSGKNTDSHLPPTEDKVGRAQNTIPHKIAAHLGFENWNEVSSIAFTFNVDRGESHSERSWVWHPKTDDIEYRSGDDYLKYNRAAMDSISRNTDAAFINDKFWLLAPFQLVWDKETKMDSVYKAVAPISKDSLHRLTVVYPDSGGYTPGDGYDFFYDDHYLIKEWNYRKGNSPQPTLTTTWEDYKTFDGIEISTMHRDSTGNFKLYFTNISVVLSPQ